MVRTAIALVAAMTLLVSAGCSSSKKATAPSTQPTVSLPVSSASTTTSAAGSTTETTATTTSATAGSLTGKWSGSYSGAFTGTFTLDWTQSGAQLAGTIDLSTAGTTQLNGLVSGSHITFGTLGGAAVITYTGTVSGNSMSGSYAVAGGGSGSWSAHRST